MFQYPYNERTQTATFSSQHSEFFINAIIPSVSTSVNIFLRTYFHCTPIFSDVFNCVRSTIIITFPAYIVYQTLISVPHVIQAERCISSSVLTFLIKFISSYYQSNRNVYMHNLTSLSLLLNSLKIRIRLLLVLEMVRTYFSPRFLHLFLDFNLPLNFDAEHSFTFFKYRSLINKVTSDLFRLFQFSFPITQMLLLLLLLLL